MTNKNDKIEQEEQAFQWSEGFRNRFTAVLELLGGLKRAGQMVGMTDQQIARWRDGDSKPSFFQIAALCNAVDVRLGWLIDGKWPKFNHAATADVPEFISVPVLPIEAAAGDGRIALDAEPIDFVPFPPAWLRQKSNNIKALRILTARGTSMAPTIQDGDNLLIDTSVNRIEDDSIYVILIADQLRVKRVQLRATGGITLLSDGGLLPEDIGPGDAANLRIVGRVIWVGKDV